MKIFKKMKHKNFTQGSFCPGDFCLGGVFVGGSISGGQFCTRTIFAGDLPYYIEDRKTSYRLRNSDIMSFEIITKKHIQLYITIATAGHSETNYFRVLQVADDLYL